MMPVKNLNAFARVCRHRAIAGFFETTLDDAVEELRGMDHRGIVRLAVDCGFDAEEFLREDLTLSK